MNKIKENLKQFGLPRIIIIAFLFLLVGTAFVQKRDMGTLAGDVVLRFAMNGVLALAMVPAVMSGTGLNFGLPIGIIAGLVGGLLSIEFNMLGFVGIGFALCIGIPLGIIGGYLYGKLLNAVKGSEMVVGTYVGYSVVSLMCIGWLLIPLTSPNLIWPIGGKGMRTTITLAGYFDKTVSEFLAFDFLGVHIPTGLLIAFAVMCFLTYLFTRSKVGIAMKAAGDNPVYASAAGISVDKMRILGTVISTVFAAIGIILYAQAFGFIQLYTAPLNMAFAPVAAVLLGGASTNQIKISHVVIGTLLYQTLMTVAIPVANSLVPEGGLAEIARIAVSNGIILYALTQSGGKS